MIMRMAPILVFAGLVLSSTGACADVRLSQLEAKYEQYLAAAEEDACASQKRLFVAYAKALDALEQAMQKEGDLDGLFAVRRESARFKEEGCLPPVAGGEAYPRLRKLCEGAHDSRNRSGVAKNRKIVSLTGSYLAALGRLKTQLTSEGALDDAVAVRDKMAAAREGTAYTAAQFVLASRSVDATGDSEAEHTSAKPVPVAVIDKKVERIPSGLRESLSLYYSFDSHERLSVTDHSGRGHAGKLVGAKWSQASIVEGGCAFDGKSAHIQVAESEDLELAEGESWSVALFLRADSLSGRGYLCKCDGGSNGLYCRARGEQLELNWSCINGDWSTGVQFRQGEWHHVVMVYDPSDSTATVYVDGTKKGETHVRTMAPSSGALWVGSDRARNAFHGCMDEFMVFTCALTGWDAMALFRSLGGHSAIENMRKDEGESHFLNTGRSRGGGGRGWGGGGRGGGGGRR